MKFSKVVAVIRLTDLEKVEKALKQAQVRGITVTRVKGYGEYRNLYSADWMIGHARVEIYTSRSKEIAKVIVDAAHSGQPGDGLVAIEPVDRLYRIRECRAPNAGEE